MHMETGQSSLMEAFMPRSLGRNPRLDRISRIIDWRPLGEIVNDIHSKREGRPSYPPLAMVKILLLQQWCNLSDPQMEEALADRISFRRFVGLGLEDGTPDHSTIIRFRSALGSERSERLFEEIAKQFDGKGMILKEGTLMDATIVAAQVRRPPMKDGAGSQERIGSGRRLDVHPLRKREPFRIQGSYRNGREDLSGSEGGVHVGESVRELGRRSIGERGRVRGVRGPGV